MFFGKIESKSIHISFNTIKVKDATNETKYEEPSVKYNSVANAFKCFKLFEHNKKFLNNIGATCEQVCMETSKDKYYTEMYNTLTDYNDRKNIPLSNAKIREAIYKFTED